MVVAELRTIVMVLVELKMVEMGVPRDLVSEMVVVDLRQVLGYLSVNTIQLMNRGINTFF